MKKLFFMALAVCLVTACEKPIVGDIEDDYFDDKEIVNQDAEPTKKFTFTVKGDFASPTMRGYLTANDNEMSELWVYDFMGDVCVQSIHQVNTDADWGQPQMQLKYGSHHVYFVASRGTEPTVDNTAHTIVWSKPSDTFWEDYEVKVVSNSNGNRAVTLDRVVTKLKITPTDEVPDNLATLSVTPAAWYYGLNYTTGEPSDSRASVERSVTVPASYVGTTGTLAMNIFGFCPSTEWTTNLTLTAKDAGGASLGTAVIENAPFRLNRVTEYSGGLFAVLSQMGVSVDDEWTTPYHGVW
jgi:hypothetical protein